MFRISENRYFYHVPKTAGSSIIKHEKLTYLGDIKTEIESIPRRHDPISIWHERTGIDFNQNNTIAIVRNPYSRMVSYWLFTNAAFDCKLSFKDFLTTENPSDMFLRKNACYHFTKTTMTQHISSSAKIYKFETDLYEIGRILKLSNFPHGIKEKSNKYITTWQNYYNSETQKIVLDKFYEDFENFGYSKDAYNQTP